MPFALIILMGVSAYLTFHAFWIWILARSESKNLWIALWCLNSLFYQANRYRQLTATSDDDIVAADRACLLAAVFVISIVLLLNHALAGIRAPRWLIGVLGAVTAVVVAIHGLTDWLISSEVVAYQDWFGETIRFTAVGPLYLPLLVSVSVVAFPYSILILFRSERLDRTQRLIFLAGYILYLLFGLNDILLFSGYIQTTSMFEYGFAVVAVGLTFARAKEIQGLQRHLEELVDRRTRQLHDSELMYRELVEQSGDVVFTVDINGVFTFVNSVVETISGYDREEFVGKHFTEIIAPEAREEKLEFFVDQVRRGVDTVESEIPVITKGGDTIWVHQINRATWKGGRIVGFECTARDITDRKRLETRLQKSEERLRTILTSVGEGIGDVDAGERFVFANPAAEEIFGVASGQLDGRSIEEFVSAETMKTIRKQSARRSLGHRDSYEIEILREDGSRVDVLVTASPNPHGPGAFGVFRDITQLKVQQQALQRAKAEAEAAVLAKTQFLANMSHEIRTPLHGIKGMLELVGLTGLTEEQRRYIRTAFASAEILSNLLGDILDYSKIDAGRLQLEQGVFDIRECVSEAVQSVTGSAWDKDIEFSWDVHPDVPDRVVGDELRLRQILVNLLSNAVKFTPEGSVRVEVVLDATVDDGAGLRFDVHDSGIGIPEEQWASIFDPFIQVDGSFSRAAEGTGLGLAICRQLVHIMGGEIEVDSQLGRGSTFSFTVAFEPADDHGANELWTPLRGIRALVVSPGDFGVRFSGQLNRRGLRSRAVSTAKAAVRLLKSADDRKDPVQVVLLDSSGWDGGWRPAADTIRQGDAGSSVRLIILNPVGAREAVTDRQDHPPIDGIVTRPVSPRDLARTLISILGIETPPSDRSVTGGESEIGRVLVVDDNEVNRKTVQLYLEKLRCSCDVAESGAQALELVNKRRYGVVLLDVQMPVMDGLETTHRIRNEVPEDEQPWIIALTAAAAAEDRKRCLEAGMDDYLSKPVGIDDLSKKLRIPPPAATGGETGRGIEAARLSGQERMDLDRFDEIATFTSAGNPDFLNHVVEAFKTNATERLKRMHDAVARDDAQTLALCAHNIKGSALQLGANQVGQLCLDLETLAKTGDLTVASDLVKLIQEECVQAVAILDLLVESGSAATEGRPATAASRETALVVGSNPDVNSVTTRLLSDLGYRVVEASDGAGALRCVSRERDRIILVVTDVQLAKISGGEFAELVRRVIPDLRIVFCSAQSGDFAALEAVRDDATAFLEKPYTVAELEAAVRRLIPD